MALLPWVPVTTRQSHALFFAVYAKCGKADTMFSDFVYRAPLTLRASRGRKEAAFFPRDPPFPARMRSPSG